MVDIEFEIDMKKDQIYKEIQKICAKPFHDASVQSVEFLFAKVFERVPGVNLRKQLHWDMDFKDDFLASGYVGFPDGSESDKIAIWTEFGTGKRGAMSFKQFFDESMPVFTIPIVPLRKKALHWMSDSGEDIFAKQTKGQSGQAWFRGGVSDNLTGVERIWETHFKKL